MPVVAAVFNCSSELDKKNTVFLLHMRNQLLWWADLGWTSGVLPKLSYPSSPQLGTAAEKIQQKSSHGQPVDKKRSLTSYCHGRNRLGES